MIFISHRGNLTGPNPERENSPSYIVEAMESGYDVEVDIWYKEGEYFLGHDNPQHRTGVKFLKNEKIWCHCKNVEALAAARKDHLHCFFHKTDDVVLTSKGHIWVYPGKQLVEGSFCVLPEICEYARDEIVKCMGVCSDFIEKYKKCI